MKELVRAIRDHLQDMRERLPELRDFLLDIRDVVWALRKRLNLIGLASVGCFAAFMIFLVFSGRTGVINEVIYEIDYPGNYNVSITENGYAAMFENIGNFERNLLRPVGDEWVISIFVKKFDDSTNLLTVRIKLPDGTILEEDSTYEPFGEAHVSIIIK